MVLFLAWNYKVFTRSYISVLFFAAVEYIPFMAVRVCESTAIPALPKYFLRLAENRTTGFFDCFGPLLYLFPAVCRKRKNQLISLTQISYVTSNCGFILIAIHWKELDHDIVVTDHDRKR